jgi:hypothetical protein
MVTFRGLKGGLGNGTVRNALTAAAAKIKATAACQTLKKHTPTQLNPNDT